MNEFNTIIIFLIGLFISTIIVYLVTKLFGEKEGIGRAFVTAIVGTIVYTVAYYLIGNGLIDCDCCWNCVAYCIRIFIQNWMDKITNSGYHYMGMCYNNRYFIANYCRSTLNIHLPKIN